MSAAVLWAGPEAALSHRAAAQLWGLTDLSSQRVEFTCPRWLPPFLKNDRLHRSRLEGKDLRIRERLPVTTPERTLFDLAAVEDSPIVEQLFDALLRKRLIDLGRIEARLDEDRRRRGVGLLRYLVKERLGDPVGAESVLETTLYALIRSSGLPLPKRQWNVRDGDELIGRVDFAYPEKRLAVEADGYAYHSGLQAWDRDRLRDNALAVAGWGVLRFCDADIHRRPKVVLARLEQALRLWGASLARNVPAAPG